MPIDYPDMEPSYPPPPHKNAGATLLNGTNRLLRYRTKKASLFVNGPNTTLVEENNPTVLYHFL